MYKKMTQSKDIYVFDRSIFKFNNKILQEYFPTKNAILESK